MVSLKANQRARAMPTIALALLLISSTGVPASAQVSVNINIPGLVQVAPPAPRYEPAPRVRTGQMWVPGHWEWNRERYEWRAGYIVDDRPGQRYVPGQWVQARGGWEWREDRWARRERLGERDRERDFDRDHERGRDRDDHRGGGGYHCPPGQAKKGNC